MITQSIKGLIIGVCVLILSTAAFAQGAGPAKVKLVLVTEEQMAENASFIGVLYFDQTSDISTEVAGMVQSVQVREGDRVKKGDVLLTINSDFLDKDILLEKADIQKVGARIKSAKKNLERYKNLLKSDAASKIDYDNLYFSHLELIKEQESLKAALSKTQLKKIKCEIKSPFDGMVLKKDVGSGDWVIPGRMLFRIGSANDLFAKVSVTEKLVRFIKKGDLLNVEINAYGEKLIGTVDGISPVADQKTKNVSLKIRLGHLKDIPVTVAENMSASVFVPVSEKKSLKIVPRDALIKFQGKDFVYTVKDGKAAILPVRILAYMGENVGLDAPSLKADMTVITDGNERLKPDQPVIISGEKK